MRKEIMIETPVLMEEDEGWVVLSNIEGKSLGEVGIVVQKTSLEEAKRVYVAILNSHIRWIEARSRELDLWKPFQKGQWNHMGGKWFMIYGINFHFRYGSGMRGGWYIPFTKLNISICNHWRIKPRNKKKVDSFT